MYDKDGPFGVGPQMWAMNRSLASTLQLMSFGSTWKKIGDIRFTRG